SSPRVGRSLRTSPPFPYTTLFRSRGPSRLCRVLKDHDFKIAPSTYYAYRSRPPSARSLSDARLLPIVAEVHRDNYGVYGVRKMRSEEHTSELQSRENLVCRLLLEK